ncbi:MAG: hypothetical protein ACK56I_06515, partial [bacterium]
EDLSCKSGESLEIKTFPLCIPFVQLNIRKYEKEKITVFFKLYHTLQLHFFILCGDVIERVSVPGTSEINIFGLFTVLTTGVQTTLH